MSLSSSWDRVRARLFPLPRGGTEANRKMNYRILTGNKFELENLVNKYIVDGWNPLGGLASMGQLDRPDGLKETIFAQAMIKENNPSIPTRFQINIGRRLNGLRFLIPAAHKKSDG
jgi:hypothetical protein